MAIIGLILWIGFLAGGLDGSVPAGGKLSGAPCLDSFYTSQVGVTEQDGDNNGPEVRRWLRASGISYRAPWCAAFIAYGAQRCGYALPPVPARAASWHEAMPRTDAPERAQLFTLFYRRLGRIGHIGYVEAVGRTSITTIEGNTGSGRSRDGDGVYRLKRLKSQVHSFLKMQHEEN